MYCAQGYRRRKRLLRIQSRSQCGSQSPKTTAESTPTCLQCRSCTRAGGDNAWWRECAGYSVNRSPARVVAALANHVARLLIQWHRSVEDNDPFEFPSSVLLTHLNNAQESVTTIVKSYVLRKYLHRHLYLHLLPVIQ